MAAHRGRPRGFDQEKVLDKAMRCFWKHGYVNTSYAELCAQTGLNKPSLYYAFGNKEEFFVASLARYEELRVKPGLEILQSAPGGIAAIRRYVEEFAGYLTDQDCPEGCLIASNLPAACDQSLPGSVKEALHATVMQSGQILEQTVREAHARGELPGETDAAQFMAYLRTFLAGIAASARLGAPAQEIREAVNVATASWPDP